MLISGQTLWVVDWVCKRWKAKDSFMSNVWHWRGTDEFAKKLVLRRALVWRVATAANVWGKRGEIAEGVLIPLWLVVYEIPTYLPT